jgi:polar amino acid transport system substrate-binding protein
MLFSVSVLRRLLAWGVASLALGGPPVLAQVAATMAPRATVVRACDDTNEWPPYTYRRPSGDGGFEVVGFSVDLLRQILARHRMTLEVELLPWKRCLEEVRHGQRFTMLLNASRTPQREQDYWFSPAYYDTRTLYIWSRRQYPAGLVLHSPEGLRTLRVGNVAGYVFPTLTAMGIEPSSRASSHSNLVQMLHRDRIDTVLVAEEVLRAHAASGHTSLWDDPELGRAPLPGARPTRFHMLFTRQGPQGALLHRLVSEEMERMLRSGELQRMRALYTGAH